MPDYNLMAASERSYPSDESGPKTAATGIPKPAATCIGPLSLQTSIWQ